MESFQLYIEVTPSRIWPKFSQQVNKLIYLQLLFAKDINLVNTPLVFLFMFWRTTFYEWWGISCWKKHTSWKKQDLLSPPMFLDSCVTLFSFFSHSLSHSRIAKHLQEDRRKDGQEICLSLETELCLTSLSKHSWHAHSLFMHFSIHHRNQANVHWSHFSHCNM